MEKVLEIIFDLKDIPYKRQNNLLNSSIGQVPSIIISTKDVEEKSKGLERMRTDFTTIVMTKEAAYTVCNIPNFEKLISAISANDFKLILIDGHGSLIYTDILMDEDDRFIFSESADDEIIAPPDDFGD